MSSALDRLNQLPKKAQWLIAIGFLFGIVAIIGAVSNESTTTSSSSSSASSSDYYSPSDDSASSDYSSSESSGQENARHQAESYLDYMAFSRKGLIKQLEYEGYSTADATYAVDNVTVTGTSRPL